MPSDPQLEPRGLSPREAFDLLAANPQAVLIDVRSTMEHLMVGHPRDCIHIAWMDEPDWEHNPRFVTQVREVLLGGSWADSANDAPAIVLICRSGRRSVEAGRKLLGAGLANVYFVEGGFEGPLDKDHHRSTQSGWRHDGLPWQQC